MSDELRKFGPLPADSQEIGIDCIACRIQFKIGDYLTLVALGPGADPEERRKAFARRPYTAVAVPIHWECAVGAPE